MRNYWLKIAGRAAAIFAVGMLLITGFRSAKGKISSHLNSVEPIPLPLIGLVPFTLDQHKLGALDRIDLLRSEPERISGVRMIVKLADSVNSERVTACQLAIDDVEHINDRSSFRCAGPTDAMPGFERFGTVVLKGTPDTVGLMVPVAAAEKLRSTRFSFRHGEFNVVSDTDSLEEALQGMADSLEQVGDSISEAMSDSVNKSYHVRADSIRTAIKIQVEQIRRAARARHTPSPAAPSTVVKVAPATPTPPPAGQAVERPR
jgi:hypothetical protein